MAKTRQNIIDELGLVPSPYDGGFFKRTYEADVAFGESGQRIGSAIYYLATPDDFSRMHSCRSDEMYHFYAGDPAELLIIDTLGNFSTVVLGPDPSEGHVFQHVVKGGCWQGLRPTNGAHGFSLVGVTLWPEFLPDQYEMKTRSELTDLFAKNPEHVALIERFTDEAPNPSLGSHR